MKRAHYRDESHLELHLLIIIIIVVVLNLKNAGVVLMTETFVSDGREGEIV